MGQELRHAARRLIRTPVFTLASVLTLALAIGANAAIFAVVKRVLLNPLPYPESDRLIELEHGAATLNIPTGMGINSGLYFHYANRARSLSGIAIYRTEDLTVTGGGTPERVRAARAVPALATVLRVSPAFGRWFTDAEGRPGAPQVVVLSHGFWQRRYGGFVGIIGQSVNVGGAPAEIVGVMAPGFAFPDPRVALWMPEPLTPAAGFGLWDYDGVARLADGATIEAARADLTGLVADIPQAFPGDPLALGNIQTRLTVSLQTLKEATIGGVARALWILLGSVGLVLLIACANVANLFLVRSEARQRDVAIRRALGAGGFGVARYFLFESALLSLAGGAAGVAIAAGAVRLLVTAGPSTLPRLHEIRLDAGVVAYASMLSILSALVFGAIPLWRGQAFASSLHDSGRANTATPGRHRARRLLMGGQIAMALVLLVSSGLLVRSFQALRAVEPGFDPSSAMSFSIGLPEREYATKEAALAAHRGILDRLSALPGVTAVTASTCLPLTGGCSGNTVRVEGRTTPPGTIPPFSLFRAVAGGYFEAMGIRVVRGRGIDRNDVDYREPIAVVSQAFAASIFPNQDPIGQRVASNLPPPRPGVPPQLTWLTIVGVVANTPLRTLAEANPLPQIYLPMSIAGGPGTPKSALIGPDIAVMSFVVRTADGTSGLLPAARRAVDSVDADLAVAQVRTLQEMVDGASAQMAFTMVLLAIAASVAVLLGIVGIYGVMSYIVSQRTGEIGVRLALGAAPATIAGMIVRQGVVVSIAGIAAGLAAALAGGRLLESLLYGVGPRDPVVFAATTLVLLAVALVACWLPARRAARLNPLEALRAE
jgi:predicted permease